MKDEFSDKIYRNELMEIYKNPENYGEIKYPTHKAKGESMHCGDEVNVFLNIKGNKIEEAKFNGSGCILSIVSSSLLMNKLRGMKVEDVKKLNQNDVLSLFKVKISPGRMNCVLLPFYALKKALG